MPVLRLARPFGRFATAPGLVRLVCRVGVSAEAACIAAAFDGLPTQLGGLAAGSRDRLLVSRFALVSRLVRCHCPTLVLAAWCGVVVAVSLVWVLGGASCSFSVVYGAVAQVGEGVPVVGEGVPVVGGLVALVRLAFTLVCGGLALVDLAFPFVWVHVSVGPCVWAVLGGSLTPLGLGSQSDREGMALFGPALAPIVCLLAKAQGGSAEFRRSFAQFGGISTELPDGIGRVGRPIIAVLDHPPTLAVETAVAPECGAGALEARRAAGDTSGVSTHATSTDVHTHSPRYDPRCARRGNQTTTGPPWQGLPGLSPVAEGKAWRRPMLGGSEGLAGGLAWSGRPGARSLVRLGGQLAARPLPSAVGPRSSGPGPSEVGKASGPPRPPPV